MSRMAGPLQVVLLVASIGAGVVSGACGPSYQAVHEGDVRFEHCYAIDEGAAASMDDKSRCWREYRENYAFGQARDRLVYASRREQLLARSQSLPTDEAMMEAAPGQVAIVPNAPAPTNAFVPPPQLLQENPAPSKPPLTTYNPGTATAAIIRYGDQGKDGGAPPAASISSISSTTAPAPREAPGASCATQCSDTWHACEKTCVNTKGQQSAAASKAACDRCDKAHRTCMAACFR